MSRRRVIGVALFAMASIATFALIFRTEPIYLGASVSEVFADATNPTNAMRLTAKSRLVELGEAAVPHLTLRLNNNLWQRAYEKGWPKLPGPVRGRLPPPRDVESERLMAVEVLRSIGPPAKNAIPELARLLEAELVAPAATGAGTPSRFASILISTLAAIGGDDPEMAAALLKARAHSDRSIANSARSAFYNPNLAPTTRRCLKVLIPLELQNLDQQDAGARWMVIGFLGRFGRDFPEVPDILGKVLLEDEEWRLRALAANALGNLGPAAVPARSALEHAGAKDEYLNVREAAREALEKLRQ